MTRRFAFRPALLAGLLASLALLGADPQPPFAGPRPGGPGAGGPPIFGPGGSGGPGGPGPMQEERRLVGQFDQDGDGRLDAAERRVAREFLAQEAAAGRGPRRPGGGRGGRGPGGGQPQAPASPGEKLTPADVKPSGDAPLYDPAVLRTLFLQFENADWEKELGDFYNTDVEVPATLTVDGRTLKDVGVRFRGASSFFTVEEGRKRSLNLSLNDVHKDQRLLGHRTLNLLNSHTDPTFLRVALYTHVAGQYLPAPRANYVRVVINGESWGVYVNLEQVNADFARDRFGSSGPRWKVPGSPRGQGGLAHLGDSADAYRRLYEIKSKDDPKSWDQLIRLTRVLNQTPPERLEEALAPILDVDGALKFLALENVFINSDGYWTRASDYHLIVDDRGRFHLVPHDVNETFAPGGGPGMGRGFGGPGGSGGAPGGGGVQLDPFAGADDPNKALLHRLLAVPALRARYLGYVKQMAEEWLDWDKLGPLAAQLQTVIAEDVKKDTRKLYPFEAFTAGVDGAPVAPAGGGFRGPGGPGGAGMSLKSFAEQRRAFLLNYQDTGKDRLRTAAE